MATDMVRGNTLTQMVTSTLAAGSTGRDTAKGSSGIWMDLYLRADIKRTKGMEKAKSRSSRTGTSSKDPMREAWNKGSGRSRTAMETPERAHIKTDWR